MGGMASIKLDTLAANIWHWCLEKNIFISAIHIAGVDNFVADLNAESLQETQGFIEKGTEQLLAPTPIQFERMGYFVADSIDHSSDNPVFNQTVGLKDNWQKS